MTQQDSVLRLLANYVTADISRRDFSGSSTSSGLSRLESEARSTLEVAKHQGASSNPGAVCRVVVLEDALHFACVISLYAR